MNLPGLEYVYVSDKYGKMIAHTGSEGPYQYMLPDSIKTDSDIQHLIETETHFHYIFSITVNILSNNVERTKKRDRDGWTGL